MIHNIPCMKYPLQIMFVSANAKKSEKIIGNIYYISKKMAKPLPKEYPLETVSVTTNGFLLLHRGEEKLVMDDIGGLTQIEGIYEEFLHGDIINTAKVPLLLKQHNTCQVICCLRCLLEYEGVHTFMCNKNRSNKKIVVEIDEDERVFYKGNELFVVFDKNRTVVWNDTSTSYNADTPMRRVEIDIMSNEEEWYRFYECPGCLLGVDAIHDQECRYINS